MIDSFTFKTLNDKFQNNLSLTNANVYSILILFQS